MECNLLKSPMWRDGMQLIEELYQTKTPWQRMRGLLARAPLHNSQALLLDRCNSVHMVGMKYPIDVCFLDRHRRIIKTVNRLKPWQFSACLGAHSVIELSEGSTRRLRLEVGDSLSWIEK